MGKNENYANNFMIDVLIPTRDRPDSLPLVLLQLNNQTAPPFRVIIRDEGKIPAIKNGSARYAITILKEKGHEIIYWRSIRREKHTYLRSQLLRKVTSPFVLFLDDNVLLNDPEIIAKMIQKLKRHPLTHCITLSLCTNSTDLHAHYSIPDAELGCTLFRREKIIKVKKINSHKSPRAMKSFNRDDIIYIMKNCSNGPGKQLPYSISHLKLAHNRLRKWSLKAKKNYTPSDKNKKYPLDILINTRDRLDSLPLVLTQLANQKIAPFRLLIRDESKKPVINGPSVRGALYLLKQEGHKVVYFHSYRHGVSAFYRRQILLRATAPIVMFLDDDIILDDPEIISKLIKELRLYQSAYCTVVYLYVDIPNSLPNPSFRGNGLGCIVFYRNQVMQAGAFDFYRLYGNIKDRNQDNVICEKMSYLYGPGRQYSFPTHHLELFRKRSRKVELKLNNPISTFSYFWIKSYRLRIPEDFLHQPYQSAALMATEELLKLHQSIPRSSIKTIPSSLAAIHRFLIEKKHTGLFSSPNQAQLLHKLIQVLTDIRQDVHHSFIYHYLSKKPQWQPDVAKHFRYLTHSSNNHHILSQSARALAQFGNKNDRHYLLNKAREEPSLLKGYMVYCLIRTASCEFLLKAARIWSKSSHWVDKLLALSMAQASSKRFPHQAEKIIMNIWKDSDELVQWKATNALAELKKLKLLDSLINDFHEFDSTRQAQLIWLLGEKGTTKHFSFLLSVLDNSRDSRVRGNAALSLGKLVHRYQKYDLSGIKNRLIALADQKSEPDCLVRALTIKGISGIPQFWARKAILGALKDNSTIVQKKIIITLGQLNQLDVYFNQKMDKGSTKLEGEFLLWLGIEALCSGQFELCQKFFTPSLAKVIFENILRLYSPNSFQFNLSPKQMRFIFTKLEKGQVYEKLMASWFLGHTMGRKKMLPVLLEYLGSKNFTTRLLASYLLCFLKNKKTFPFLTQALKKKDDNIKLLALWGLSELGSASASQIVKRYLSHKNIFLRLAALKGLRPEKRNEKLLCRLSKLVKDKDIRVRLYAVEALGKFYHKEDRAKELLHKAIYDRHFVVRDRAFEVLKSRLKFIPNKRVRR